MNAIRKITVDIIVTDQDAAPLFNFAFEVGQKNPEPPTIPFRREGEEFRCMVQNLVNRAVVLALHEATPTSNQP